VIRFSCRYSVIFKSGDPNVPANHLSFVVNLGRAYHPLETLRLDNRPVVLFPHNRGPVILSFEDRINSIVAWYRGKGQINRFPSAPDFQWVGINFIIYREPLPGTGTQFTVLWDDQEETYRHAIDYWSLPAVFSQVDPNNQSLSTSIPITWSACTIPSELQNKYDILNNLYYSDACDAVQIDNKKNPLIRSTAEDSEVNLSASSSEADLDMVAVEISDNESDSMEEEIQDYLDVDEGIERTSL
jgi:hypothetical protein